jgi:hypothetical protein
MKTIILLLSCAFIVATNTRSVAQSSHDWVRDHRKNSWVLTVNDDTVNYSQHYYDSSTIRWTSDSTASVASIIMPLGDSLYADRKRYAKQYGEGFASYKYTVTILEFDCAANAVRILSWSFFNDRDENLGGGESSESEKKEWAEVKREWVISPSFEAICSRVWE